MLDHLLVSDILNIFSSNCVPPHLLAELTEARDYFLGDPSLRTATLPVEGPDGKRHGGTHFERVEKPSGINFSRAYTLGPSDQSQNSVASPVKWGKLDRHVSTPGSIDDLPDSRVVRAKYVRVCVSCILCGVKYGIEQNLDLIACCEPLL